MSPDSSTTSRPRSLEIYRKLCSSTTASDSSFKKIQTAQNAALRTATGAHKMVSIDHLQLNCSSKTLVTASGNPQSIVLCILDASVVCVT